MGLFSKLFGYPKITLREPFDQMKFYCSGGTCQLAREVIGAGVSSDWHEVEALVAHLVFASYFYDKKYGANASENEGNLDEFFDFLSATFTEFFREAGHNNLSEDELTQLLDMYGMRLEEYLPILDHDLENSHSSEIPFYAFSSNLAKKLYQSPQDVTKTVPVIGRYFDTFAFIMDTSI